MTLLRYREKIIYFAHIPKTGGSSVEYALRQAGVSRAMHHHTTLGYTKCCPQHMHADLVNIFFPNDFYDYSFAVVRHPFDRLVSEYSWRVKRNVVKKKFDPWVNSVLRAYENNNYICDNHIRAQSEFVTAGMNVFKFGEGIPHIIKKVSEVIGIQNIDSQTHRNKGKGISVEWSEDTKMRARKFYAVDFTNFSYDSDQHTNKLTVAINR